MRIIRGLATAIGVTVLAAALAVFAARFLPVVNHSVLVAALVAPLALLAAPVSAAMFAIARRWIMAGAATLVTVVIVGTQLPAFVVAAPAGSGAPVRIVSLNLHVGRADPAAVVKLALDAADVLAVQELTPQAAAGLSAAGLDAAFPHRLIDPRPESSGIGLWSRHPLTDTEPLVGFKMPALMARVEIPGAAVHPVVGVVHLIAPWPAPVIDWRDDVALLPKTLARLADVAGDGAVLVAGDFNSTTDLRQFREALTDGYRNAAQQAGAAFTPSYPADRPALSIDHVLTRNATARAFDRVSVRGTDHLALVVDVSLGR
jgi:endonuclease/exonuclease/phosphatase (EEP) superfamily protein YafD